MEPLREDDPRSLGGFRVLALLAVGGMGRVYLALGADRRAVALKVARAEFAGDARFRARFRREVETGLGIGGSGGGHGSARSGRPGRELGEVWIAPVVAADPDAELPWLASEYVPGPSVTEALMGFGPLSATGLRTLARGLALALAEVHAAGVVHRDVKPSNVLLARDGPRLIDFGVARAIDDVQLTRVGAVIGSPGFLSPEQATGKPASFGSDVFSMASVIAYAACGVGPFGAGAGPALLYRVVHEAPKLVNVPRELAEVLAACLVKEAGDRPSAAEVAARVPAAGAGDWLSEAVLADIARREAELAAWVEVAGGAGPLRERAVPAGPVEVGYELGFETDGETGFDAGFETGFEPGFETDFEPDFETDPEPEFDAEFEAAAHSALELANAGFEFEIAADSALKLANAGTPHAGAANAGARNAALANAGAANAAVGDAAIDHAAPPDALAASGPVSSEPHASSRPRTSHRRTHRRTDRRTGRPRIPVYAALGALLGAAAATTVLLLPHGGHDGSQPPPGPSTPQTQTSNTPAVPNPAAATPAATPATPTQKTAPTSPSGRRSGPTESTGRTTSASGSPR